MTNINYRSDIIGDYINKWYVVDEACKIYHYKTEAGALNKYNSISGRATLKRETTVVNQDVTALSK